MSFRMSSPHEPELPVERRDTFRDYCSGKTGAARCSLLRVIARAKNRVIAGSARGLATAS